MDLKQYHVVFNVYVEEKGYISLIRYGSKGYATDEFEYSLNAVQALPLHRDAACDIADIVGGKCVMQIITYLAQYVERNTII